MRNSLISVAVLAWMAGIAAAQVNRIVPVPRPVSPPESTITVTGQGQVYTAPDQATLRLGATVQADQAAAAQNQLNQIMQAAIDKLKELGIAAQNISTADLTLSPVYSQPPQPPRNEPYVPKIAGFRASNILQIRVDDLKQIGPAIDAVVGAGANQLQGITFSSKNDTEQRQRALQDASRQAAAKAAAIAAALNLQLGAVDRVIEGNAYIEPARAEFGRGVAMAAAVATPVEPGQVQVQATVTVQYRLVQAK